MKTQIRILPTVKTRTNADMIPKERLPETLRDDIIATLPANNMTNSEFGASLGNLSMHAITQKGETRDSCDDRILVVASDNGILIGVFDGFKEQGGDFSREVPKDIIGLFYKKGGAIGTKEELGKIIGTAGQNAIKRIRIKNQEHRSGTTVTVAFVSPDGKFIAANLGDSAAYVKAQDKTTRLFDYATVTDEIGNRQSLEQLHPQPERYANIRRILSTGIISTGTEGKVEMAEGVLEAGATLILATDGLTKQLWAGTNPAGDIIEASGSNDLAFATRNARTAETHVSHLIGEVNLRTGLQIFGGYMYHPGGTVLMPQDDDVAIVAVSMD